VVPRPRLYINHLAEYDWLVALEFGRVDDSQPPENWRGVSDDFGFLHEKPGGRVLGFKVLDFSEFDPEDPAVAEIWEQPLFDVPVLGLAGVPAGEVVLAARALLGDGSTVNRHYFNAAIGEEDLEEARSLWLGCLQAGDSMAHYGLGYTLYELGDYPQAYRHLRHYTEIAPHGSWIWFWFGQAAESVGERDEAIAAYTRALELEAEGDEETDAAERLKPLIGFEGMSELRNRLNRETEGAVGLYSTAEHHSSGQSAKVLTYWHFDRGSALDCPVCGWHGSGDQADMNVVDELFDLSCPSCDRMLVIVGFPTEEETREAASRGNAEAQRELERIEETRQGPR